MLRILLVMVPVLFTLMAIADIIRADYFSAALKLAIGTSLTMMLWARYRAREGHDTQQLQLASFILMGVAGVFLLLSFF